MASRSNSTLFDLVMASLFIAGGILVWIIGMIFTFAVYGGGLALMAWVAYTIFQWLVA